MIGELNSHLFAWTNFIHWQAISITRFDYLSSQMSTLPGAWPTTPTVASTLLLREHAGVDVLVETGFMYVQGRKTDVTQGVYCR